MSIRAAQSGVRNPGIDRVGIVRRTMLRRDSGARVLSRPSGTGNGIRRRAIARPNRTVHSLGRSCRRCAVGRSLGRAVPKDRPCTTAGTHIEPEGVRGLAADGDDASAVRGFGARAGSPGLHPRARAGARCGVVDTTAPCGRAASLRRAGGRSTGAAPSLALVDPVQARCVAPRRRMRRSAVECRGRCRWPSPGGLAPRAGVPCTGPVVGGIGDGDAGVIQRAPRSGRSAGTPPVPAPGRAAS